MKFKKLLSARDLRQLFNVYQITQLIKSPTRIASNSSTLIDLALATDVETMLHLGSCNARLVITCLFT